MKTSLMAADANDESSTSDAANTATTAAGVPSIAERSAIVHEQLRGKIAVQTKMPITSADDLALAYTPGVAEPCRRIADDAARARDFTMKRNSVAVVSDGSAVLGLGDIGPYAAMPVMEGKALLFKEFAGIDAWPLCLDTERPEQIIEVVKAIAPGFGGVNLEDIAAPACFQVEAELQDLGIPVFHDDQHGTAIVLLAALLNAAQVTGRSLADLKVVVNGAGAAGTAIARLLRCVGHAEDVCEPVREIIVCDSQGVIHAGRSSLNPMKRDLLSFTNPNRFEGRLQDALIGADVFIGVSRGDLLEVSDIERMADDAIIFAMANPTPEIMPELALQGGAAVVGTGRSDFPNQVNNVLAFPGIFRGALDADATRITETMKIAAAKALADAVGKPTFDRVLPDALDRSVAPLVAAAVARAAAESTV